MAIHGVQFNGNLSGSIVGRNSNQATGIHTGNHYHKRRSYSTYTGASGGTYPIMRYGRHWWGTGNFHVHIHETWYGPSTNYGHFIINGHTRSANPSIATVYNHSCPTPFAANYNSTYERCDIQFSHGAYFRYTIVCEVHESVYSTSDGNVGHGASDGGNSWHMYGSAEIV